jgi:hypothetical protein
MPLVISGSHRDFQYRTASPWNDNWTRLQRDDKPLRKTVGLAMRDDDGVAETRNSMTRTCS